MGNTGSILRTSNGGVSWFPQTSGTSNTLMSVHFTDSQTGWAAGNGGTILKTANGGADWLVLTTGTTAHLKSIHFADSQTGWAVGNNGIILKTTNGGSSWSLQTGPTSRFFSSVWFSNSSEGWIAGGFGTILHTSTGGVTPIHKTIVSSPTFSLYPNPAEEYIHLNTKSQILSITIINALGRTVETTHALSLPEPNGQVQPSGSGSVSPSGASGLNISSLQPGLYWVKIQTAEGTAVQKLIRR